MADQYNPIPVKTKGTADVSVRLRNVADTAYMGDNTTPMQVGDGGGSLTIDSPGVPTALGQTTMSASMPVTLASNQSSLAVTVGNATLAVTQSTSPWVVAGNVASGASDSGNPVKTGGVFNTTLPTLTNGQRGDTQLTAKGTALVTLADSSGNLVTVTSNRLLVDGSGVTQPVSGTVTANIGTSGSLALDATLTGGTQKTKLVDTGGTNVASISAAGAVKVDGSAVTQPVSGTVGVSGTVTVDSELPTAAALADATSNPTVPGVGGYLMGFNGTTWDRVRTANTGRLQVDVITGGGGGASSPSSPQRQFQTAVALAIATPTSYPFTEIGAAGITAKLYQINVSSTVPCKWELFRQVNSSTDANASLVLFTNVQMPTFTWNSPHPNFVTIASSAGNDNWILKVTNLDNALAADIYMTLLWDQV